MQIMNMGNYAHGNQPIQHMLYMYNYSGQPWKAQHWIREVMDKLYTPAPDGYCGDETTVRLLPGMYSRQWDSIRYVRVRMNMFWVLPTSRR